MFIDPYKVIIIDRHYVIFSDNSKSNLQHVLLVDYSKFDEWPSQLTSRVPGSISHVLNICPPPPPQDTAITLLWSSSPITPLESDSSVQFSSVQSLSVSDCLWPHESQHARPPCPSPTPRVHSDSRPSSWWCHPAISSSVVPFPPAPNPSQHQSLFQWVKSSSNFHLVERSPEPAIAQGTKGK